MKVLLLILLVIKSILTFSQNYTAIRSKDSLLFLYNTIINNIEPDIKVIGIGEQWHGDGTTFSIKSDLILELSKKKNIVFLSESSSFDCMKGLEIGVYNDSLNLGISNIWSKTKEFQPLMNALKEKKIEYAGMDVQVYDTYSKKYLSSFLKMHLTSKSFLNSSEKDFLVTITDSLVKQKYQYKFTNATFKEWQRLFDTITFHEKEFSIKDYYILFNIKNFGFLVREYSNKEGNFAVANRYRDSLMALNCNYLIENIYKDKLVIISAASFHLIKNHSVDYPKEDKNVKTLGDFLCEKYGKGYSTIVFTSAVGTYAPYNNKVVEKVPKPINQSIEKLMYDRKYAYACIDLKKNSLPFIYCMPDGYEYIKMANPLIHFDSIFYVREMQRANRESYSR